MTQQEAHIEAMYLMDDGNPYPQIIHVTHPTDHYVVFRNERELNNWKNMNKNWDIRFTPEKFPAE